MTDRLLGAFIGFIAILAGAQVLIALIRPYVPYILGGLAFFLTVVLVIWIVRLFYGGGKFNH
ncbi:hypothetical protein [Dietzia sp. MNB45]|uniref:hypothetical protein n=1 Tax=Dietzia sp. MNB45 TaxID=3238800 RepID=UPI003F7DBAB0